MNCVFRVWECIKRSSGVRARMWCHGRLLLHAGVILSSCLAASRYLENDRAEPQPGLEHRPFGNCFVITSCFPPPAFHSKQSIKNKKESALHCRCYRDSRSCSIVLMLVASALQSAIYSSKLRVWSHVSMSGASPAISSTYSTSLEPWLASSFLSVAAALYMCIIHFSFRRFRFSSHDCRLFCAEK